jgi:hypothetical protein
MRHLLEEAAERVIGSLEEGFMDTMRRRLQSGKPSSEHNKEEPKYSNNPEEHRERKRMELDSEFAHEKHSKMLDHHIANKNFKQADLHKKAMDAHAHAMSLVRDSSAPHKEARLAWSKADDASSEAQAGESKK